MGVIILVTIKSKREIELMKEACRVAALAQKEIEKAKSYRDDFLKRNKKMSNKFEDFLNEQLKDPKVKKEYDALEAKYALIESIILARKEKNLTQKELSQLTGITQADLSKIENGNANPSLNTLLKLAKGLGKKLQISLV